jgi:hypothetical protein
LFPVAAQTHAPSGGVPNASQPSATIKPDESTNPEQSETEKFGVPPVGPSGDKRPSDGSKTAPHPIPEAQALSDQLQMACKVTRALQVAEGPAVVNGNKVSTKSFEIACASGMGYFLVSQAPEKPYGFSCFVAEATRAADAAQGRPSDVVCTLVPTVNDMASNVLTRAGTACRVHDVIPLGHSVRTHTEYTQVDCDGGKGYVLGTEMPGWVGQISIASCADSAKHGIACKM